MISGLIKDTRYIRSRYLKTFQRFIRGMVTSGIRSSTPPSEQDHFVILVHGEQDLKHFVGYSSPRRRLSSLLDAKGEIRWRGHGLFKDEELCGTEECCKTIGVGVRCRLQSYVIPCCGFNVGSSKTRSSRIPTRVRRCSAGIEGDKGVFAQSFRSR